MALGIVPATHHVNQNQHKMDTQQDSSLFGLNIDPNVKNHLSEAAKWAKFLAIVGFVICGLVVLMGIFAGSFLASMGRYSSSESEITGAMSTLLAVVYILFAVLYFIPVLFLYRFATQMKIALASNDQGVLTTSFQNLKRMFRYVGILTIIVLAFYALALLFALLGVAATR